MRRGTWLAATRQSAHREPRLSALARFFADGLAAGTLSTAALLWRGRHDARSAAAPLNAVARWFWPRRALRQDGVSARYTGTGTVVHYASSLLWAALYEAVRTRRRRPDALNAVTDAAAVTALAAVVDLKLVPRRLQPGFEERLAPRSLVWVYAGFAAGLALRGMMAARRR